MFVKLYGDVKLYPQSFDMVIGSGPFVSNAVPQSSNKVNVITYVFGSTH